MGIEKYLPHIKFISLCVAILFYINAYASFGGSPCKNVSCYFQVFGLLLGIIGIPISVLIFSILHLYFCNQKRSKGKQALLGILNGIIAFEIAAFMAAVIATLGNTSVGYHLYYPALGFVLIYVPFGIFCIRYVRSCPK